jgi:hypothetical protein
LDQDEFKYWTKCSEMEARERIRFGGILPITTGTLISITSRPSNQTIEGLKFLEINLQFSHER